MYIIPILIQLIQLNPCSTNNTYNTTNAYNTYINTNYINKYIQYK